MLLLARVPSEISIATNRPRRLETWPHLAEDELAIFFYHPFRLLWLSCSSVGMSDCIVGNHIGVHIHPIQKGFCLSTRSGLRPTMQDNIVHDHIGFNMIQDSILKIVLNFLQKRLSSFRLPGVGKRRNDGRQSGPIRVEADGRCR